MSRGLHVGNMAAYSTTKNLLYFVCHGEPDKGPPLWLLCMSYIIFPCYLYLSCIIFLDISHQIDECMGNNFLPRNCLIALGTTPSKYYCDSTTWIVMSCLDHKPSKQHGLKLNQGLIDTCKLNKDKQYKVYEVFIQASSLA